MGSLSSFLHVCARGLHRFERALGLHPPDDSEEDSDERAPSVEPPAHQQGSAPIPGVRPEVVESFPSFTRRFEGFVRHPYLDVKGYVTTGIGNLIDPVERALPLPWLHEDGRRATEAEVRADWQRVKGMPHGPTWTADKYAGPLHLDDAGIAAVVHHALAGNVAALARTFPDFPSYPAAVQTALLSMAWAMGAGFPAKFPTFSEAVRARDWQRAAEHCSISTEGGKNPGIAPRNAANRALLLQAGDPKVAGAFSDWLAELGRALVQAEHGLERWLHLRTDAEEGSPLDAAVPSDELPTNGRLLAVALRQLPDAHAVIAPGSAAFDAQAGGRVADYLGAPAWRYFATYASLDPSGAPRWGGSTCATALAHWMGEAGDWPRELIDRAPDDTAPGHGFTPGHSLSDIVGGAKARGFYVPATAAGFQLRRGDIYHADHEGRPNSDHVGIVRSLGPVRADGTREVGTLDGGQSGAVKVPGASDEANAALSRGSVSRWQARSLSADERTISLSGSPARLLGVIRSAVEVASVAHPADRRNGGTVAPLDPATLDPATWAGVTVGEYIIRTNAEPLARGGVPVPMSFEEEVAACRHLRAVPLTAVVEDARLAQATVKTVVPNVPSPDGAHMVGTAKGDAEAARFAASYGPLGSALRAGGSKVMLAERDRRQVGGARGAADLAEKGERGIAYYGWLLPNGAMVEHGRGDRHFGAWKEYGSYGYVMLRAATRNGEPVDLLAELARGCSLGGPLVAWLVAALGGVDPRVAGVGDREAGGALSAVLDEEAAA